MKSKLLLAFLLTICLQQTSANTKKHVTHEAERLLQSINSRLQDQYNNGVSSLQDIQEDAQNEIANRNLDSTQIAEINKKVAAAVQKGTRCIQKAIEIPQTDKLEYIARFPGQTRKEREESHDEIVKIDGEREEIFAGVDIKINTCIAVADADIAAAIKP